MRPTRPPLNERSANKMLPLSILMQTKLTHQIEINGVNVSITLVDNPGLASRYLEEFRSLMQKHHVVGFDAKTLQYGDGSERTYGVVCVGTRCLVFLSSFEMLCAGFDNLINDQTVCFVGTNVSMKVLNLKFEANSKVLVVCKTAVEIGYFVSRVLMRGDLDKCGLSELASALGIYKTADHADNVKAAEGSTSSAGGGDHEWLFSPQKLKSVVEDAYTCFAIANKALTSI